MEGTDDDFGDLYADVEVQASSAINGVSGAPQLFNGDDDGGIGKESDGSDVKKVDSVDDYGGGGDDDEEEESEENGSDSEDDFNIVLNDDDDDEGLEFHANRGARVRNGRVEDEHKEEEEVEGGENGVSDKPIVDHLQNGDELEQSSNGRDRRNGVKGCYISQYKYTRYYPSTFTSTSKGNTCGGPGSYSSHRGDQDDSRCHDHMRKSLLEGKNLCQFSLPRSRTILDVNIDAFDEKPWRHPGANITDFFNFGFDEDSWKNYCNHLDRYRHGDIRPMKTLTLANSHGFYEALPEDQTLPRRHERNKFLPSENPSKEQKHSETQKGRAIQVAGSTTERQSSMDTRRPIDWDSDVIIQINVQERKEELFGPLEEKEKLGHIDSSEKGEYDNENFSDDGIDGLSSPSFSEDELHRESLDGHDEQLDPPASKRCSLQKEQDGVALCDKEGTTKNKETSRKRNEEVGRSTCNAVPTILGAELSDHEWNQGGRRSSFSGSDYDVFKDGAYVDAEKSYNYAERASPNPLPKMKKLFTSDFYHSKDFGPNLVKSKHRNCKPFSRHRNLIREDLMHEKRSLYGMSGSKRNFNGREASSISEMGRIYDVHYLADDRSGQEEMDGFNSYNGDDFSYYKENKFSLNYHDGRFPEYQIRADCRKYPLKKGSPRFKAGTDQFFDRNFDERAYLHQEKARDWDHYESKHAVDSMHRLTCQESRPLSPNYLENNRDARWGRRGGKPLVQKGMRNNTRISLQRKYCDGPSQQKYKRSGPSEFRDMNNFVHEYEEHLPFTRREIKSPEKSRRKYIGDKDDFWFWRSREHGSCFSCPSGEPHVDSNRSWEDTVSPESDICEGDGRGEGYNRQILTERSRDSDVDGSYTEAFDMQKNVSDLDCWVYSGRGRQHCQSELLHWTEDESISRHQNNIFHAETISILSERTSWHKQFDVDHETGHVSNLIDDMEVDHLNGKPKRGGNSGNRISKNNMSHSGNHEQMLLTYEDSADSDLVDEEGKSVGRSAAGSVMYNDTHNMDWNSVDVKQTMFVEFNKTHIKMVRQNKNSENGTSQNNKKRFKEFSDAQKEEDLDIEEGQILIDDIKAEAVKNNIRLPDTGTRISDVKGLHNENATKKRMTDEGSNSPQILEVLAKMERRRERFKEPITLKEKISKPLVSSTDEISRTKQQRPARKRRWGEH